MKRKNYLLAVVFFILISLTLAACGDSPKPTATTAPTTAAATTAASTTAVATTVAATTAAPTTAAKTTTAVATTAVPTTVAKTTTAPTTAASTSGLVLPSFANTIEVSVPKELNAEVEKQLTGVKGVSLRVFGSTDDLATLTAGVEKSLGGAGYASLIPGTKGFEIQKENAYAAFSKAGSPDLLLAAADISTQAPTGSNLGVPGLSAADAAKFATELKGKKTMLLVMGAKDLMTALATAQTGSKNTPVAATAAATTAASTVDSAAALEKYFSTLTEVELDPEVASAITLALPGAKNLYAVMAASDSDYMTTAKNLDQLLSTIGYKSGRPDGSGPLKKLGDVSIGGIYAVAGQPDVVWAVTELTADFDQTVKNLDTLEVPGLDKADLKKFFGQISGKKSFLVVISGQGMLNSSKP